MISEVSRMYVIVVNSQVADRFSNGYHIDRLAPFASSCSVTIMKLIFRVLRYTSIVFTRFSSRELQVFVYFGRFGALSVKTKQTV